MVAVSMADHSSDSANQASTKAEKAKAGAAANGPAIGQARAKSAERQERLAAQLRENLKKRKALTRARKDDNGDDTTNQST